MSDKTSSSKSGLINHDEPMDIEAHLTSLQARMGIIEDNQKKTQYLIVLNQESLTELLDWFQGAKKSLRILILIGNFLVWFSKVGTAFILLYTLATAIIGSKLPGIPGLRWFTEGDHH